MATKINEIINRTKNSGRSIGIALKSIWKEVRK
jgi:hypothetical protein